MQKLLLIGLGGFLGAVSRYWVGGWVQSLMQKPTFPVGTLIVNVSGCFLIGFIAQWLEYKSGMTSEWRFFLLIGLLGAFTTYSTFTHETFNLLRVRELALTVANIGLHLFLGLIAYWLGLSLAHAMRR